MSTVITKASKQKRMMQFYNLIKQHSLPYLCVAYDKRWTNNPITPVDTDKIVENNNCTILGYQTVENIKFVQVILILQKQIKIILIISFIKIVIISL